MTKLEEGGKGLQKSAKVKVKLLKDLKTTKERGSPKKVVEQKSIQQTEKDILTQEKRKQEIENYKENEINWLNDAFWINSGWDGLKGKMIKMVLPCTLWRYNQRKTPISIPNNAKNTLD